MPLCFLAALIKLIINGVSIPFCLRKPSIISLTKGVIPYLIGDSSLVVKVGKANSFLHVSSLNVDVSLVDDTSLPHWELIQKLCAICRLSEVVYSILGSYGWFHRIVYHQLTFAFLTSITLSPGWSLYISRQTFGVRQVGPVPSPFFFSLLLFSQLSHLLLVGSEFFLVFKFVDLLMLELFNCTLDFVLMSSAFLLFDLDMWREGKYWFIRLTQARGNFSMIFILAFDDDGFT